MLKMVVKIRRHMAPDRLLVRKLEGVHEKCCDLADRALCGVPSVGVVRVTVKVEVNKLYGMTMSSRPTWPFVVEIGLLGPEIGLLGLEIGLLEGGPARRVM